MMKEMQYHYDKMSAAIAYIVENFKSQPGLEEVAAHVNMSDFHFQRLFTEWAGVSPKKFLQFITTQYLKSKIRDVQNLPEAAELAGLSTQSRVYDHFVTLEAMTPAEYKLGGKGLSILYGVHETPFGQCFIAITKRGVCSMAFLGELDETGALEEAKNNWPAADFQEDKIATANIIHQIFHGNRANKIHLLVKGTNFQVKVWEALLRIPGGSLATYSQIAQEIGRPGAERAVGNAVGNNPVAFLIPCHRVIRKEGGLGGYHWGLTRKYALLGCELSRSTLMTETA
ncbi:methylated-DNA--[protein]-cysteine S-methyltransferase [Chitinophaga caeni]|nr:methylated-DNA--[protein]-cysteine S-methyltransferase [Chitinophaga caeni]